MAGFRTKKYDGDTGKMLEEATRAFQLYLGEKVGGDLTRDQVAILIEVGRVYHCRYVRTRQLQEPRHKPRHHVLEQVLASASTREDFYRPHIVLHGPLGQFYVSDENCAE